MLFRDSKELSVEISKIFREIDSLPKINCSKCGATYRGEEKNFVCSNCKEQEKQKREEQNRKNYQIQTLLNLSNIPIRYEDAKFEPKTETQQIVSRYFMENFT